MANTGKKIVLTLKERKDPAGTFTGNKKDNIPSDPDYIADYIDTVACPLVFAMTCPVVISTRDNANLIYEFNLLNEVVQNPAIKKVTVSTTVGGFTHTYVLPHAPSINYFTNTFTTLNPSTHYDLIVRFLDASDSALQTCNITVA